MFLVSLTIRFGSCSSQVSRIGPMQWDLFSKLGNPNRVASQLTKIQIFRSSATRPFHVIRNPLVPKPAPKLPPHTSNIYLYIYKPHGHEPGCSGTSRVHGELKSPRTASLPWPTTPPSGSRVGRCTYGWPLPCLLNYCSAGPWVAAAAPPHSHPFSVPLPGGLRFLGFGRCCTLDSCDQAFVNSDAVSRASAWYSADESEVVARILSFCCGSFFRWLFVHCL